MNGSIGFVEVIGLVAAIEVADAMTKAARVSVKTITTDAAGGVTVICEGDLGAVGAAVDAGKAAGSRLGECVATNVIPRPDDSLEVLVNDKIGSIFAEEKAAAAAAKVAANAKRPATKATKK
ncbi:BMC domain-containing protein [Desulfotalea psychrophila]|uniref:Related to ethanolamine utilization protein (EutM) n=1 Tax=Desulfotalea psychrophila (strain LSv54 / DSM 12343) TaxID=177439 RepID=Q6AIS0_DESPS|nr:BMC domain-containing protein [Desulfotalea psychrophila]CAG37760.1 related to ethanolamine utilization protein (EutM) [Desulfotalea psychrophila LSv54]